MTYLTPQQALARALCIAEGVDPDTRRAPSYAPHYMNAAQRILEDPGPVLAALAPFVEARVQKAVQEYAERERPVIRIESVGEAEGIVEMAWKDIDERVRRAKAEGAHQALYDAARDCPLDDVVQILVFLQDRCEAAAREAQGDPPAESEEAIGPISSADVPAALARARAAAAAVMGSLRTTNGGDLT